MMHWSLIGMTEAQLLDELRAEEFAMAHGKQSQAERARSVVRVNQINDARGALKREERRQKRLTRFREWLAAKEARRNRPRQGQEMGG